MAIDKKRPPLEVCGVQIGEDNKELFKALLAKLTEQDEDDSNMLGIDIGDESL